MKPAEFRRMMSRLAHPQGAQRYEVEFGKPLVPDTNLQDTQTEPSPVTIQPAILSNRDLRVKDPSKQSHTVAWGGGGGVSVQKYILTATADTSVDAGATVTQVPEGTTFNSGTSVVLTAVRSSPSYVFTAWTGDVLAGHTLDNPLTVVMDSDRTITATFEI